MLGLIAAGAALAAPLSGEPLAQALALPVASELIGAEQVARFAWVETAAGVRNIRVAEPGRPSRLITRYDADDGQQLYDLAFNRDGSTLAYVRGGDEEFPDAPLPNAGLAGETPRQQVFVIGASGGTPHPIGEGHSPVFAPDGRHLAFTRKGELWLWSRGSDARRVARLPGTLDRLQWSPDGRQLLFVDDRGDHSFIGLFEIAGDRLRYLDPGLDFAVEPSFSPDGTQIAFIRFLSPPAGAPADAGAYWSIRIADVASGETRLRWRAPAGEGGRYAGTRRTNLFWTADGELVFPWERTGWLHTYALPAAGDEPPRDLTPGEFEVESFRLSPDRRALVYVANAGDLDRHHLWRRAVAGGPAAPLSSGSGSEAAPVSGGGRLAALATDAAHPAHPVLVETNMAPLGPAPALESFVVPLPVAFKAADGERVHAQLFSAPGPGKHPALVFVHGGPRRQMLPGFHPMGYYSNAYILNQQFAAAGYDVLSVNYRSGTGYGRAFRDAPDTARDGASEYRDVLAAGRWLAARDDVDASRIGIWGGSWGGYLTALALARDSALFKAGADFHGVHTMLRPLPDNLSPAEQAKARQLQWDSSPMGSIEHWRSPVLLVHGDDDRNVDFDQSLLLARELAARGVPFEERVFPNERHEFIRYADWLASYQATLDFFDRRLKQGTHE